MSGLSDRQRINLERFLIHSSREKQPRQKTSARYLLTFPENRNKRNVLVNNIIRDQKPGRVWYSHHALFRGGSNSLTKNEINATIRSGAYMPSRNAYYNSKYSKMATNRGTIAPLYDQIPCPKRRISNGQQTVVLSFCYPRGMKTSEYRPEVVTAYKNSAR